MRRCKAKILNQLPGIQRFCSKDENISILQANGHDETASQQAMEKVQGDMNGVLCIKTEKTNILGISVRTTGRLTAAPHQAL